VRLAGGALIIAVEKDLNEDNASMIKATYILVNLGIVPLLAAYDGLLCLMYDAPFSPALPRSRTKASKQDLKRMFPKTRSCVLYTRSAVFSSCSLRDYSSEPEQ
jgi:hypothetical protein